MDGLSGSSRADPLNERVLEAGEYGPDVDPRARIGIGIVIVLLAFPKLRRCARFGRVRTRSIKSERPSGPAMLESP